MNIKSAVGSVRTTALCILPATGTKGIMSSLKAIAEKSGFSVATVSRAMNNSVLLSRETTEKIQKIAAELDYVPNIQARTLAGGSARLIGFIASEIRTAFDPAVLKGIEDAAKRNGYNILICLYYNDAARTESYQKLLNQPFFDGIIVGCSGDAWRWGFTKKPIAYVDRWSTEPAKNTVTVTSDHAQSAHLIIDFFKSHNVCHVLFYGQGSRNPVEAMRLEKIREVCFDNGLPFVHISPESGALTDFITAQPNKGKGWGVVQEPSWEMAHHAEGSAVFLRNAIGAHFDQMHSEGIKGVYNQSIIIIQDHEAMGRAAFEHLLCKIRREPHTPAFKYIPVTGITC